MSKINFQEIKNILFKNSIAIESKIDDSTYFSGVNSISNSSKDDITFFSNIKYLDTLKSCKAKACIIKKKFEKYLPETCDPIIVDEPYLTFAYLLELFNKNKKLSNGVISKNVYLHNQIQVSQNVQIDNFSNILENVVIEDGVIIGSNCKIGPNVIIKKNCIINDNVSISDTTINEGCEIKSGARIGGSGFGFDEKTKKKIIHIGNVIIENYSTIGSNTTIDKAVFESTIIGEYSQIDNLVQIAHNVIIGKHAIIAAQVGIAGSTTIGDFVKIGGQAGIAGHLNIGNNVTIAGKSGVTKNIIDNKIVAGFPAKDINSWKREIINLGKMK